MRTFSLTLKTPRMQFQRSNWLLIALSLILPIHIAANETGEHSFSLDNGRNYLVIGKVTRNPNKHVRTMKPIADYLASNLSHHGVASAKVKFAKNLEQMIQYLNNGEVDYVTETVYGASMMMHKAQAKPILLRWKKGQRDYQSIIFTHKDSGIDKLSDLRNHKIAFEDEGSTSSYFIPKQELDSRNLPLTFLTSPKDSVPEGNVGYLFSGSEQNTSALVYSQLADAGAVNSHDWSKPNHMPTEQSKYFKKLFVSERLPRSIELISKNIKRPLRDDIVKLLIEIDQQDDKKTKKALKRYQQTTKFEELGESEMAALQRLMKQFAHDY